MPVEVSAVIPTRNRPDLVCRAIRSVLAQTFLELEVVVVIDGPDTATENALAQFTDTRLRVISLPENVGGSEARNIGVRCSVGCWIAFLDDDDEWFSQKIEKQIAVAKQQAGRHVVICTQFIDRMTNCDLIRPRRFLRPGQAISEFIWCECSILGGIEGFPQTSTWMISRELILEVPFTKGLRCLQDLDWLIRALSVKDARAVLISEPLALFHNEDTRARVAKNIDWRYSYSWGTANRAFFTPEAFSFFLIIYCVNPAARQNAPLRELFSILKECRQFGRLTAKVLFLFFLYVFIYPTLRSLVPMTTQRRFLYNLTQLFAKQRA